MGDKNEKHGKSSASKKDDARTRGGIISGARATGKAVSWVHRGTLSGVTGFKKLLSRKNPKQAAQQDADQPIPQPEVSHAPRKSADRGSERRAAHAPEQSARAASEQAAQEQERSARAESARATMEQERSDRAESARANNERAAREQEKSARAESARAAKDQAASQQARARQAEHERAVKAQAAKERAEDMDLPVPLPETTMSQTQTASSDRVLSVKLRHAMDDLLYGTELGRSTARDFLVGQGRAAESLLIGALQELGVKAADATLDCLARIGSPRLLECISYLNVAADEELRLASLRAAQRLSDEEARPFFERGLRDPAANVRRRVLLYLSWRNAGWAQPEIRRLCDDTNPFVQWAALEALLAVNPEEAREILNQMMPSLDAAHRRRAVTLLEQRGGPRIPNSALEQTPLQPVLPGQTFQTFKPVEFGQPFQLAQPVESEQPVPDAQAALPVPDRPAKKKVRIEFMGTRHLPEAPSLQDYVQEKEQPRPKPGISADPQKKKRIPKETLRAAQISEAPVLADDHQRNPATDPRIIPPDEFVMVDPGQNEVAASEEAGKAAPAPKSPLIPKNPPLKRPEDSMRPPSLHKASSLQDCIRAKSSEDEPDLATLPETPGLPPSSTRNEKT